MDGLLMHRTKPVDKHEGEVTPEAVQVLGRLPNVNTATLTSWLYSSRLLEDTEEEYMGICDYVKHGQLHGYGMEVVNVLRVVRNGVKEFDKDGNYSKRFRMILWHGTKQNVISSILQNGFKKPNENGQMFGPGLYFADRTSKSANYCDQRSKPQPGTTTFLLLCDVFLGRMYNSKNPKIGITDVPSGKFDSVMCTGRKVPDREANRKIKGSIFPCGPTIANTKFPTYALEYNEYIVYDPEKIRIKYLVEVKYHAQPV